VAPVALAFYGDVEAVAKAAAEQGEVTGHSHPLGTFGAQAVALVVHRALERGGRGEPFDADGFLAGRPRAPEEYHQALDWMGKHREADPATAAYHLGASVKARPRRRSPAPSTRAATPTPWAP